MPKLIRLRAGFACGALSLCSLAASAADPPDAEMVARGRYVISISGCNDCHTAGYALGDGQVPESQWLTGDHLGWKGPWGTTYPVNLRRYMGELSEDQWVERAKVLKTRPPMPWFNVRKMSAQDLRAVYRYVRSLGPVGDAAPGFLPPGQEPAGPAVSFPAPPPR